MNTKIFECHEAGMFFIRGESLTTAAILAENIKLNISCTILRSESFFQKAVLIRKNEGWSDFRVYYA